MIRVMINKQAKGSMHSVKEHLDNKVTIHCMR